jgi:predicted peroxiredoxin
MLERRYGVFGRVRCLPIPDFGKVIAQAIKAPVKLTYCAGNGVTR